MFKTLYGKSLEEETFEYWLEKGRSSHMGHHYLLILWDTLEESYLPAYVSARDQIESYAGQEGREILVAAYDLYSESRISTD